MRTRSGRRACAHSIAVRASPAVSRTANFDSRFSMSLRPSRYRRTSATMSRLAKEPPICSRESRMLRITRSVEPEPDEVDKLRTVVQLNKSGFVPPTPHPFPASGKAMSDVRGPGFHPLEAHATGHWLCAFARQAIDVGRPGVGAAVAADVAVARGGRGASHGAPSHHLTWRLRERELRG